MNITPREIKVEGFEMVEKQVKVFKGASSGSVYLPKEWDGKTVVVIRID